VVLEPRHHLSLTTYGEEMALSLHINNTKKASYFDGTNYAYWKVEMTAHLKSINREVWKVTETKFEVANENAPTPVEEKKL